MKNTLRLLCMPVLILIFIIKVLLLITRTMFKIASLINQAFLMIVNNSYNKLSMIIRDVDVCTDRPN